MDGCLSFVGWVYLPMVMIARRGLPLDPLRKVLAIVWCIAMTWGYLTTGWMLITGESQRSDQYVAESVATPVPVIDAYASRQLTSTADGEASCPEWERTLPHYLKNRIKNTRSHGNYSTNFDSIRFQSIHFKVPFSDAYGYFVYCTEKEEGWYREYAGDTRYRNPKP